MNTHKIHPRFLLIIVSVVAFAAVILAGAGIATASLVRSASGILPGFLPLIMKLPAEVPVTSSSALVIFSSSTVVDGNPGGRSAMNDVCASQDPASHFCSLTEIEDAWTSGGVRFQSPFVRAWVDNPYLGTVVTYRITGSWVDSRWKDNLVCDGWSANNVSTEGTWIDNNGQGLNIEIASDGTYVHAFCNELHNVACCKTVP